MSKFFLLSLCTALAVLGSVNVVAGNPYVLDLGAVLKQQVAANAGRGGGVFRVQQGANDVLWQGASGNWAYQKSRIWALNTFEIASITKTFTATVIMQLHEDDGSPVRLWTPIGNLLPSEVVRRLLVINGHDYGPEITVAELLQHTSGLPDFWESRPFLSAFGANRNRYWKPAEIIPYVKKMAPLGRPSTQWTYSDTNYVLLGLIIEAVTGQPLEKVFRTRILEPLNMTETYFSYLEKPTSKRRESHRYEYRQDLFGQPRQSADWASGGLVSNVEDLQKFVRALFTGALFAHPETLQRMMVTAGSGDAEYGLGLFRIDLGPGLGDLWGHGGWGNSFMYYWPQEDIAFTGTLNQVNNTWGSLVDEAIAQWIRISR